MRASTSQFADVVAGSHASYLTVDVLHGTDRVAQDVRPVSWSLDSDLSRDPKTTGSLTIVHQSVAGESWVPDGVNGVLSPFRATLLLTLVTVAGGFEERTQLGLFDVVAVPFAEDTVAHVNARFRAEETTEGDIFPLDDVFPADDEFPGDLVYGWGELRGGVQRVVTSTVTVDVASLDERVLRDSLTAPADVSGLALDTWRRFGLLPVASVNDVTLPHSTFPAEAGSRLDLVQTCARVLGGVPVVNSLGTWTLIDDTAPLVELEAWGDQSTVVDITHSVSTDEFANYVVGHYETENGDPIDVTWEAPGRLSPASMGRRWVFHHTSDLVRSKADAEAMVAQVGVLKTSREVDVPVVCVFDPRVEIGDRVRVNGWVRPLEGVAQKVSVGDGATMTVTVRTRRSL